MPIYITPMLCAVIAAFLVLACIALVLIIVKVVVDIYTGNRWLK